jgi:site-specific DNA-methyltransferase (adenine-specific)
VSVVALSAAKETRKRRSTATANFGSGRREGHDASAFYDRFVAPEVTTDTTINRTSKLDVIYTHDARDMAAVAANSVALVVTSPPYFAGKQYEEILGVGGVPANYFEYLDLLHDVFAECKRVLEPGGRIAVNVANLGRRPYRSLSGDVTEILQRLGLLMRGEVIWLKGKAAGGSCAWGTFQRPSNPVLRDVTERIVIASKGRFDRALKPEQRLANGLPSTATISRDEFVEATTDLWEIAPESATKVGHPAPFPVELPQRLIELYTYEGDVVLDPFMGSGSAALAAMRTARHFIGFDTDKNYVAAARRRVTEEQARLSSPSAQSSSAFRVELPAVASRDSGNDAQALAVRDGLQAKELAGVVLSTCGFRDIRPDVKPRGLGIALTFVATDQTGREWAFDVSGAFTTNRTGLRRADTLWKSLGKAAVLHESRAAMPLILMTTDAPARGTAGYKALDTMRGPGHPIVDVIELLDPDDQARLRKYAQNGAPSPIG